MVPKVRSQDIPVSGPVLCTKAKDFVVIYGVDDRFKATQGWLCAFRSWHDVVCKNVTGEEKSAPSDVAQGWREKEMVEVLSQYDPNNIFNADETVLSFKLLPECMLTVKGEKCKSSKKSEEKITVLFCCNLMGHNKTETTCHWKGTKAACIQETCTPFQWTTTGTLKHG